MITVLILAFLTGFLIRLQANRARLRGFNQGSRLSTVTGENAPPNDTSSSKDKAQHEDNLNKTLLENPEYIKSNVKDQVTSTGLHQMSLLCTSPTDPDVVQLHLPATGKY